MIPAPLLAQHIQALAENIYQRRVDILDSHGIAYQLRDGNLRCITPPSHHEEDLRLLHQLVAAYRAHPDHDPARFTVNEGTIEYDVTLEKTP